MSDLQYTLATDAQILKDLGGRLAALRKGAGLSQTAAAERAGLSRNTLYRAEQGDNPTLQTVIRLLRVYGRVAALEQFVPVPPVSPIARLEERRKAKAEDA